MITSALDTISERRLRRERRVQEHLDRSDPLCLRLASEEGLALIEEVVDCHGSATAVEELLGLSVGHLNRFRRERYMTFDLVDRLLLLLGQPWRLDDYEFRRRSAWRAEHGPADPEEAARRRKRKRRSRARAQTEPQRAT